MKLHRQTNLVSHQSSKGRLLWWTPESYVKQDAKFVICNFNANVGKKSIYETTNNGYRLINFADSKELSS